MTQSLVVFLVMLLAFCQSAGAAESDGEVTYKARCAVCHGQDGVPKGSAKGAAAFNDKAWKEAISLEAVEKLVAEGRKRMPAFGEKLTPEQIHSVAVYLKTL